MLALGSQRLGTAGDDFGNGHDKPSPMPGQAIPLHQLAKGLQLAKKQTTVIPDNAITRYWRQKARWQNMGGLMTTITL
jgi:hypothetical protein